MPRKLGHRHPMGVGNPTPHMGGRTLVCVKTDTLSALEGLPVRGCGDVSKSVVMGVTTLL